jgi:DUF4097 and DUF4098 domain-containing protein YvlB
MKIITPLAAGLLLAGAVRGSVTETITQNYPLTAEGTVALSNINGDVTIKAWDKNEVAIEAVKKAENAGDLAKIHVKIEAGPNRIVIKSDHEKTGILPGSRVRGEVRYLLRVPAGAALKEIESVNSTIKVDGVRGPVNLRSVNGGVHASGLHAAAELHSVNGGIFAEFDGLPADVHVSCETVNGGVEVALPAGAGAEVDASTVNGGVHSALPITIESSGRGSIRGTLGAGGSTLKLRSVNGGVTIRKS